VMSLRFGDEPGKSQKLAPLLLREARQMRSISLDRPKHAHARVHVVLGQEVGGS